MFKLLTTFRVAYETRNFSKTAEILFISQPAVSNQIKQLEEELECTLFKRKGKQEMHPTKSAETLYARLLNLTDDWRETARLVKESSKEKLHCRISASNTFSVYYLPELMKHLIAIFPEVMFELEMGNSEEVLEKIKKHSVDFGFIEKPLMTDGVNRVEIEQDELVIAGDLTSDLWLSREETSGVYHYMERYFLKENLNPKRLYVKNNEMIVKMLEEGLGKSLISKRAVTVNMTIERLDKAYLRSFFLLQTNHFVTGELLEIGKEIENFYSQKK
ncbi:MAG: LysR family transcriptional regulator [Vagococcus sp.]|uniref:LysR family transcriptional regulator n=1 Tax=Vagococcus sp. TaxID=1933889 RepID=UPI002FC81E0D